MIVGRQHNEIKERVKSYAISSEKPKETLINKSFLFC